MNSTDIRRFGGICRLYGNSVREKLAAAHVCVIGLGGVGSWCVEALARTGVGRLTLIDGDIVAESNINRQLPALTSTLGRPKAEVLAARAADINPEATIAAVTQFIDETSMERLIPADALIVDAIDSLKVKTALIAWAHQQGRFILVSGGAGGRTNPALVTAGDLARVTHDALLSKVRAGLRKHYGFPKGNAVPERSRPFGIRAVFSTEDARPCAPDAAVDVGQEAGFGTSIVVTASVGLRLAAEMVNAISAQEGKIA